MSDDVDYDDIRAVEIYSLQAIYPDELTVDSNDEYAFSLEVPVTPAEPVTLARTAGGGSGSAEDDAAAPANQPLDTHKLTYLPPLRLHVTLPPGYPETEPPTVAIKSTPKWIPDTVVKQLEDDCARLWEEVGRDQMIFTFVEHLCQAADDAFGQLDADGHLFVKSPLFVALRCYDIKSKKGAFEHETFRCGVCLGKCSFFLPITNKYILLTKIDSKEGAVCHEMQDCGHVFCVECLQAYYSDAITNGELTSVRCLEPMCAQEREKAQAQAQTPILLTPGELLKIPVKEALVKRYVDLTYKRELETDKNTVYCPRSWCSGAARSNRHKRPQGLELFNSDTSDASDANKSEDEDESRITPAEVCVCDTCSFAFCRRCLKSWHGEFVICRSPAQEHQTKEELESEEYIKANTTACPTCETRVSKTAGCNHMVCSSCSTHFCYLCGGHLDQSDPYAHWRVANGNNSECANRLFELPNGQDGQGDPYGDDADDGFFEGYLDIGNGFLHGDYDDDDDYDDFDVDNNNDDDDDDDVSSHPMLEPCGPHDIANIDPVVAMEIVDEIYEELEELRLENLRARGCPEG